MKSCILEGIRIDGICACVPSYTVDNSTFGAELFGDRIEDTLKVIGAVFVLPGAESPPSTFAWRRRRNSWSIIPSVPRTSVGCSSSLRRPTTICPTTPPERHTYWACPRIVPQWTQISDVRATSTAGWADGPFLGCSRPAHGRRHSIKLHVPKGSRNSLAFWRCWLRHTSGSR